MPLKACLQCSLPASQTCGNCKNAVYCSRECQKLQWPAHKLYCIQDVEEIAVAKYNIALLEKFAHSCNCANCRSLCSNIPAPYSPFQIYELLAKDSGFFKTCVQDYYCENNGQDTFFLRPPTIHEQGGTRVPFLCSRAPCVFLGPNGCTKSLDTMPLGCRVTFGCYPERPAFDKSDTPKVWNCSEAKKIMQQFEVYNKKRDSTLVFGSDRFNESAAHEIATLKCSSNAELKKFWQDALEKQ